MQQTSTKSGNCQSSRLVAGIALRSQIEYVHGLSDLMSGMLSLSLRDKDSATPFVYYFPYPKPPPTASAEAHLKPAERLPTGDLSLDEHSPLAQEVKDSPFFKHFLRKKDQKKEA